MHESNDDSISEIVPGMRFDVDTVRTLLDGAVSKLGPANKPASMDKDVAIELHRLLPLSRGVASDVSMWAWMGICVFPDYIRARHKDADGSVPPERYRSKVRQGLSRLWWAVELTCDPSQTNPALKYDLSRQYLSLPGFQDLNEALVGRSFGASRELVESFVRLLGSESEKTIRQVAKDLQCILTTMPLELMDQTQLDHEITELLKIAKP